VPVGNSTKGEEKPLPEEEDVVVAYLPARLGETGGNIKGEENEWMQNLK